MYPSFLREQGLHRRRRGGALGAGDDTDAGSDTLFSGEHSGLEGARAAHRGVRGGPWQLGRRPPWSGPSSALPINGLVTRQPGLGTATLRRPAGHEAPATSRPCAPATSRLTRPYAPATRQPTDRHTPATRRPRPHAPATRLPRPHAPATSQPTDRHTPATSQPTDRHTPATSQPTDRHTPAIIRPKVPAVPAISGTATATITTVANARTVVLLPTGGWTSTNPPPAAGELVGDGRSAEHDHSHPAGGLVRAEL
jgi:hypothetical protein